MSAPEWLAPGGHLLFETSERQAPQAVAAAASDGLVPRVARSGRLNATVVIGTRPAHQGEPERQALSRPPRRPEDHVRPQGSYVA